MSANQLGKETELLRIGVGHGVILTCYRHLRQQTLHPSKRRALTHPGGRVVSDIYVEGQLVTLEFGGLQRDDGMADFFQPAALNAETVPLGGSLVKLSSLSLFGAHEGAFWANAGAAREGRLKHVPTRPAH